MICVDLENNKEMEKGSLLRFTQANEPLNNLYHIALVDNQSTEKNCLSLNDWWNLFFSYFDSLNIEKQPKDKETVGLVLVPLSTLRKGKDSKLEEDETGIRVSLQAAEIPKDVDEHLENVPKANVEFKKGQMQALYMSITTWKSMESDVLELGEGTMKASPYARSLLSDMRLVWYEIVRYSEDRKLFWWPQDRNKVQKMLKSVHKNVIKDQSLDLRNVLDRVEPSWHQKDAS